MLRKVLGKIHSLVCNQAFVFARSYIVRKEQSHLIIDKGSISYTKDFISLKKSQIARVMIMKSFIMELISLQKIYKNNLNLKAIVNISFKPGNRLNSGFITCP